MKNVNSSQSKDEAKIQGVPRRTNLYARVSKYSPRAINRVAELLESKNESIALGAAKVILDKCLPDIKAIVPESDNNGKLQIEIIEERPIPQAQ